MQNQNEIRGAVELILTEAARMGVTVEFGDAAILPAESYYIPTTRRIYVCEQVAEERLFALAHELGHADDFIGSGLLDVLLDIILFPFPRARCLHNEQRAWKLGEKWIPEQLRISYREAAKKELALYKQASLAAIRKSCVLCSTQS